MGKYNKQIHCRMLEDEDILVRPITETMKFYNVSYPAAIKMLGLLRDRLIKEKGWEYIRLLENKKTCLRTFKS